MAGVDDAARSDDTRSCAEIEQSIVTGATQMRCKNLTVRRLLLPLLPLMVQLVVAF